eukprot:403373231
MIKTDKSSSKNSSHLYVPTELFNNEQIKLKKNLQLDVWDLGGKLPHLWVHHFKGTQGIVFIIDEVATLVDEQKRQSVIQELLNVIVGNPNIPIVLFINKKPQLQKELASRIHSISSQLNMNNQQMSQQNQAKIDTHWLQDNIFDKLDATANQELSVRMKIVEGDLINEKGLDQIDIKKGETNLLSECIEFLISNMKPL